MLLFNAVSDLNAVSSGVDDSIIPGIRDWLRLVLMYRSDNPHSQRILEVVEKLLDRPYKTHALIHGEPGTGKEGLARALHHTMHEKRDAPFVKMPTGGRDSKVLALHLFGSREQQGAIERARGGTLFLDEVATIPREIQARLAPLLRGHYRKNDDDVPRPINVCVMGATDHNLLKQVEEGSFRSDLYYRLSRLELTIPALRDRPDDIPRAAVWAANRLFRTHGIKRQVILETMQKDPESMDVVLTEKACSVLRSERWEGNFRALDRVMERALMLYRDDAEISDQDIRSALA